MRKRFFSLRRLGVAVSVIVLLMALGGAQLWAEPAVAADEIEAVEIQEERAEAEVAETVAETEVPQAVNEDQEIVDTKNAAQGGTTTVSFTVVDKDGPLAGVVFTLRHENGDVKTATSGPDGVVTFANAKNGASTLTAAHNGYEAYSGSWQVNTGNGSLSGQTITLTKTEPPETYTITYTLHEGTNPAGNPGSYKTTDTPIVITEPARDGYTFAGWKVTYASETLTDITTEITPYSVPAGAAGSIALEAVWKEGASQEIYGITYALDEGTKPANPVSYKITDTPVQIADPIRDDCIFEGWQVDYAN
jgi:uncharacterized repeat protein (TIGR02543 family)